MPLPLAILPLLPLSLPSSHSPAAALSATHINHRTIAGLGRRLPLHRLHQLWNHREDDRLDPRAPHDIAAPVAEKYGKELLKSLDKEISGNFEMFLLNLMRNTSISTVQGHMRDMNIVPELY